MIVTLTGHDITRIAFALGLDSTQMLKVVDFYIQPENTISPIGLQDTIRLKTENGMAVLALRKNKSHQCIFLDDDLCMIHPARPGACRAFPFVFSYMEEEISWGLSALKSICPGLGSGEEVDFAELYDIAQEVLEDLALFREFGYDWNQRNCEHTAVLLLDSVLSDPRFAV